MVFLQLEATDPWRFIIYFFPIYDNKWMMPSTASWFQCLCVLCLHTRSYCFSSYANNKGTAQSSPLNDVLESRLYYNDTRCEQRRCDSWNRKEVRKLGQYRAPHTPWPWRATQNSNVLQPRQSVPHGASSWVNMSHVNFMFLEIFIFNLYICFGFIPELLQALT